MGIRDGAIWVETEIQGFMKTGRNNFKQFIITEFDRRKMEQIL